MLKNFCISLFFIIFAVRNINSMANPICLSPLKFYDSLDKQEFHKSYAYNHIVPLILKGNILTPFQFVIPDSVLGISSVFAVSISDNTKIDVSIALKDSGLTIESVDGYKILILRNPFPISELKYEGNYYLEVNLSNEKQTYIEHIVNLYTRGVYDAWKDNDLKDWNASSGSMAGILSDSLALWTNTSATGNLTLDYGSTSKQKIDVVWNPGNATGSGFYAYIKFGDIAEIRFYGQTFQTSVVIKNSTIYTLEERSDRESERFIHVEFDKASLEVKLDYTEAGLSKHSYSINMDDASVDLHKISIGFNSSRLPSWTNTMRLVSISITSEEVVEKQLSSDFKYYSEIFCCTNSTHDLVEIEYGNRTGNFSLKNGVISFADDFKFKIYLKTELGKPNYEFEEEATKRLGYAFIESQVSKKIYRFNTVIPEYLCDAMRLIRLCSDKVLKSKDEAYDMLTFEMEVDWQTQGDLASVTCEFETDNVLVNLGGFIPEELGGDFRNAHFNNDYNNQ